MNQVYEQTHREAPGLILTHPRGGCYAVRISSNGFSWVVGRGVGPRAWAQGDLLRLCGLRRLYYG